MSAEFTGPEILEIALRIEKNGERLYRALAQRSEFLPVQQAFRALAGEEEKHAASFRTLQEAVGPFRPDEAYPGEYALYLRALVDENIFADAEAYEEAARGAATVADALDLALRFEKETMIFFLAVRDSLSGDDREVVEELLRQERGHVRKLAEIKQTLAGGS